MAIFKKIDKASLDASKPSLDAGDSIGQFEVVRSLGTGRISEVYLVKQPVMNIVFAVKLLKTAFVEKQPELVAKCLQDVKFASSIRHANIVETKDTFMDNGKHLAYIVMEYVEGCSLAKLMQTHPLTPRESFQMALAIAEALQLLLKQNIVHHAVKPENIMMGSNGSVKLADLCIAKMLSQNVEELNNADGISAPPPSYTSPEQLQNPMENDSRSDIYSLGATLYHALCGRRPFDGLSPEPVTADILNNPPPPLAEQVRNNTPEFVTIVEWMMDKDPSKRPQSYEDLIPILKAAVECERVRSPKTMDALRSLLVKQHLIEQPWLDKKVVLPLLKKFLPPVIGVIVLIILALLFVNYQSALKRKVGLADAPIESQPSDNTSEANVSPSDEAAKQAAIRKAQDSIIKTASSMLADLPPHVEYKDFLDAARAGNAAKLMETNIRLEPDADLQDENGDSAAILAAKAGSLACLRYLANEEFDVYSNNKEKENILNISTPKATTSDIVDFIIKSTTNTGILTSLGDPNKNGDTALHLAAANKKVNFMPTFLKYLDTISVNATNNDGLTALDIAVKNNNIPAVQALLKNRAKITEQTKKFASPEMQDILKPFEIKE
ncbi:MAG: protein kinase [Victivallales bacterium]|nr:protein kinase [Victivallales bacterium]